MASLSSALAGATGAINHLSVAPPKAAVAVPLKTSICRASASNNESEEHLTRRTALALLAGVAFAGSRPSTASAAYGESANIFGTPKVQTGFTPYEGDGFTLDIPSKWNPSKENEFPGTVLRYEDNFDQKSNLSVLIQPSDKKSITDYGSPESFLEAYDYLLGKQAYAGKTSSEGGFSPDAVVTASLLESKVKDINGNKYYLLDILTRTADGDEGGTHQLITASVKDGKLYILKVQAGDKRWFKGAQKFVKGAAESFSVA